jgi:hypothetical protein
MSLCGALAQMSSVDGPPSQLCLCAKHYYLQNKSGIMLHTKHNFEGKLSTEHPCANAPHKNIILKEDHLQNIFGLMPSFFFVWNISPEVFCRLSSFKVMSLCGALTQRCSVVGPPSKLCFLMLHKKTLLLKEDQLQNTSGVMLHTKTYL